MLRPAFRAPRFRRVRLLGLPLAALLLTTACSSSHLDSAFIGTFTLTYTSEDGDCYPGGRPIADGQSPTGTITLAATTTNREANTGTLSLGILGAAPSCSVPCRFTSQTQIVVDSFDGCAAFLGLPSAAGASKGQCDLQTSPTTGREVPKLAVTWSNAAGAACTMNDVWTGTGY